MEQNSLNDTLNDFDGESMNMSINDESPRQHIRRPEPVPRFEEGKKSQS